MGIKLTKGADFDFWLEKTGEDTSRAVRRIHADAADEMAQVASEMAPFKTGDLEGSIEVTEVKQYGNRVDRVVGTNGVPYAVYMHEGFYELGPGSQAKQETSRFPVGRKFMDRAADYLINEWGLYRRLRDAVKRGLK